MSRVRVGGQLAIGFALSAVLIWLSVRTIEWPEVWKALRTANYFFLLPIMLVTLLAFWIRALRWGWLLRTIKPIGVGSLFSATMIGFAANNLLPARLGEFVRAWAIGRSERISKSSVFATVIVERVVDMFALLLFLALMLALHDFPGWLKKAGFAALTVNLAFLIGLVVIERNPEKSAAFSAWLGSHLPRRYGPRVATLLGNFAVGLGVFRHGPGLLWVSIYSILMFGVTALGLQACMAAFQFPVPWYAGLVMLVVTSFGILVAPTPGYVGAVQFACIVGLGFFHIPRAEAFSFSLYYHVSQYLPITVVGLFYLGRQGLSLTQVAAASREEVSATG